MTQQNTGGWKRFVLRVEFIPYVVFTVIGAAVLYFVGGIGLGLMRHGTLLPPPTKLERFTCGGPTGNFELLYQNGVERVEIKSAGGKLEGTLSQNQFDWNGFGNDRNVLGFAPPAELVFEDSTTLRISGPDLKSVACARSPAPTGAPAAPPK
jgi:hypothetical protein